MRCLAATTVLLALTTAGPAHAGDCHFMMVFASQRPNNRPQYAHSFAAFVKARCDGGCIDLTCVEAFSISWLPEGLDVDVYRLMPECGVNVELHATIRHALGQGCRISVWGPYQIKPELYHQALTQKARLESGAVRYKAIDTGYPTERVSNCIHALSDLAVNAPRLRVFTPAWGETASYLITRVLSPWIIDPCRTHDCLLDHLGLTCYPLVRRDLETSPTRGPVRRAFQGAINLGLPRG
jgi:hypothetical protein